MSRLIDADKLDSYIKEKLGGNKAEYELFATMIDNQSTAYDVDKVVEQLEKKVFTADLYDFGWNGETVDNLLCLGDVCEIVKGAVKDE